VRIVLDTNVVLSALLWSGTPHQLLAMIRQHRDVQIYTSPSLFEELADVLARPFATQRLARIGKTARQVLTDYAEAVEFVEPIAVPRVVAGDVDDDQVIAAAVASRADLIVSGDRKHLLPLGAHQGIPIMDAAEATKLLLAGTG
jgi:putative PIN family toxin of toxin-antitoxin system